MLKKTGTLFALSASILIGHSPAAEIDVLLIAGQSNAAGRADSTLLPPDLRDSEVEYFYHVDSGDGTEFDSGGTFAPLAPVDGTFGPEFGLARTLISDHGLTDLAIIKRARAGTDLSVDWAPGGAMYDPFIADCTTALNLITAGEIPSIC